MQRSNRVVLMLSGSLFLSGVVFGALAVGWDAMKALRRDRAGAQAALPELVPAFGSPNTEPEESVPELTGPLSTNVNPSRKPDATTPRFSITPLDTQLGGRTFYPVALNNQGEVLGGVLIDEAEGHQRFRLDTYLFRKNSLTRLAPLPGFKYSWPMAMNNRGQIVCIAYEPVVSAPTAVTQALVSPVPIGNNASELGARRQSGTPPVVNPLPNRRIVLWDRGTMRDLRICEQFVARGMSRDVLDTLARVRIGLNDRQQLTLALDSLYWWADGKLHLAGGRVPMAAPLLPLNNQGVLVRPSVRGLGARDYRSMMSSASAFSPEWYDITRQREEPLAANEVWDMNDKSEVLCSNIFGEQQPARQFFIVNRHGNRRHIATLPTYAASFINNKGQVVGLSARINPVNAINTPRLRPRLQKGPFLWQNGGLYDVNDLLPTNSGWTILQVRDFNDRGEMLVYAVDTQQKAHSVLLRPIGPQK